MSTDPYEALGVQAKATDKQITAAYRKLAKKYHPDLNPGDVSAEERFKKISAAYNLLGDAEKRARYDVGEVDADGMEKPQDQYYHTYARKGPEQPYYDASGFRDFGDESDLFAELFARAQAEKARAQTSRPMPGELDRHYNMSVTFLEATLGANRRVTMPDGSILAIKVPAGIENGMKIRLKNKGSPAPAGGKTGDAYVKIKVEPHKFFERKGSDIILELPISLDEAILGAKIAVPTIHGKIMMNIPKGAGNDQILRLKGKGISASKKGISGNQLVHLKVILPKKIDTELSDFMKTWRTNNSYSVRSEIWEKRDDH